jgi:hypothetical protein
VLTIGAFAVRRTRIELLGAEPHYKRLWAPHRKRLALPAHAGSPIGWLEWPGNAYGRPLARRAGLAQLRQLQRVR